MALDFSKEQLLVSKKSDQEPLLVSMKTVHDQEGYQKVLDLERIVWGDDFSDLTPTSILMVTQKVGGLTGGAFLEDGTMVGLIYGLTGPYEGELAHWSHMMAVHPEYRDYNMGKALKLYQREWVLVMQPEVNRIVWTFDPLESKNAHLNMNHLGGLPEKYALDVYGPGSGGLQAGLGTDRFIFGWRIKEERVKHVIESPLRDLDERFDDAPAVNTSGDGAILEDFDFPEVPLIRIEVPREIQKAKEIPGEGARWRAATRKAFKHYMDKGYHVVRFYSCEESRRSYYVLMADAEVSS